MMRTDYTRKSPSIADFELSISDWLSKSAIRNPQSIILLKVPFIDGL